MTGTCPAWVLIRFPIALPVPAAACRFTSAGRLACAVSAGTVADGRRPPLRMRFAGATDCILVWTTARVT